MDQNSSTTVKKMSRTRPRRGQVEEPTRPIRMARSRNTSGAALKSSDLEDDEFDDMKIEDEEEEEVVHKRGSKRKIDSEDEAEGDLEDDIEDMDEDEGDDNDEVDGDEVEGDEVEGDDDLVDEADTTTTVKKPEEKKGPKKRGRKKIKFTVLEDGIFDEEGNPFNIKDDEVVIDHEDSKGCEKITENGVLLGGRQFRMKTFNLLGDNPKLFMISTEPARLVGFRDSYLLFKTHRSLFKKVCTNEEKMDLIDRGIIPNSYKGRSVNLVAARSIFREFGAKVIFDGKKVVDDFWEQRAIDNGDIAGDFADPTEAVRPLIGEASFHANMPSPIMSTPTTNYQSDETWMYQIATQTKVYNRKLLDDRNQAYTRGIKDIYTNLAFFPLITQPKTANVTKTSSSNSQVITFATKFVNEDIKRKITGLKSIPKEIFADIEDEEIKQAILAQQEYEKSVL